MAQWNHAERTLTAKIVYYGPALGGKTTNLQQIHRITDPEGNSRLISLKTSNDRTLFFDLLPFDLGKLLDYGIRLQLYTVPGQVVYNSTRRIVLTGADGLVFVADSTPGSGAGNRAAWENLRVNLQAIGQNIEKLPVVIQYNKQDVPGALPPGRMHVELACGIDGIPAVAVRGEGVIETISSIVEHTLGNLAQLITRSSRRHGPQDITEHVRGVFGRYLTAGEESSAETGARPSRQSDDSAMAVAGDEHSTPASEPRKSGQTTLSVDLSKPEDPAGLPPEELLRRSVDSSMAIAAEYGDLRLVRNRLADRVRELESLHSAVRRMNLARDPDRICEMLATEALGMPGAAVTSVLSRTGGSRTLVETVVKGRGSDPANAVISAAESLASRLLDEAEPRLVHDISWDLLAGETHPAMADLGSLIAIPLASSEHPPVLLIVYGAAGAGERFGAEEMRYLSLLAMQASAALDNAVLYRGMASYNEMLESEVKSRTLALKEAYEKLTQLELMKDEFVSNISHEMRTPLTKILASVELIESMWQPKAEEEIEFVSMIRSSAKRLGSMIENVIQLGVLRQGGARPVVEEVYIDQLIERAKADMRDPAMERSVRLVTDLIECPTPVTGDGYLLRLAIEQLLENAIKFSPEGGEVTISARETTGGLLREDPMVTIEVRDQGPGIPESEIRRVLERFEQVGKVLTSKPAGIGLGLPLVREITRQHGGEFRLECPVEGGTVAAMDLPAGAASGSAQRVEDTEGVATT